MKTIKTVLESNLGYMYATIYYDKISIRVELPIARYLYGKVEKYTFDITNDSICIELSDENSLADLKNIFNNFTLCSTIRYEHNEKLEYELEQAIKGDPNMTVTSFKYVLGRSFDNNERP